MAGSSSRAISAFCAQVAGPKTLGGFGEEDGALEYRLEKTRRFLIRNQAHVERRFRFRGYDVDSVPTLNHRRGDGISEHRGMTRLVLCEIVDGVGCRL